MTLSTLKHVQRSCNDETCFLKHATLTLLQFLQVSLVRTFGIESIREIIDSDRKKSVAAIISVLSPA